jgi:hypothetical protein
MLVVVKTLNKGIRDKGVPLKGILRILRNAKVKRRNSLNV